jgi:hypothetical protein
MAIITALLIVGCQSVRLAQIENDIAAKKFEAVNGMAVLYVVQNGGYGSFRVHFLISVNEHPLGGLDGWTYHRIVLPPGNQTIIASSAENELVLQLQTTPGSISFVAVPSTIGVSSMQIDEIKQLDEYEGKKAVMNSKMALGHDKLSATQPSPASKANERMTYIKELKDKGLLSQDEYEAKRKEILKDL